MKAKSKTTPRADPNDASAPPALRQIRDSARSLATEGKTEEAFDLLVSALDAVLRKSRELELKVLKLERERAGKRSERVDPGQLQLMFEQLMSESGDDGDEKPELDLEAEAREDAEPERQIEEAQKTRRRAKRKKPRRETIRTAGIERELPLDSNLCEQQMRAIALGRRSRFSRRRSTRRLSLHPHAHLRRERRTNIAVPYGRAPQTRRRLA